MQKNKTSREAAVSLAAKTSLLVALVASSASLTFAADEGQGADSVRTVEALLAIDNAAAKSKAEARVFGGTATPTPVVAAGSPEPAENPEVGLMTMSLVSAQETRLLAVYGHPGDLRADIKRGLDLYEGLRLGSHVQGCEIASITSTKVTFVGGRCAALTWDGQ